MRTYPVWMPFIVAGLILGCAEAEPRKIPASFASMAAPDCVDCNTGGSNVTQTGGQTSETSSPPVDEPPIDEPPIDEPPVDEPPVDEPPVDEPPVDEPPVDEPPRAESCEFDYAFRYASSSRLRPPEAAVAAERQRPGEVDTIAHMEPAPAGYWTLSLSGEEKAVPADELVMPDYDDAHPQFPRSLAWGDEPRCYELHDGAHWLTEEDAWGLYERIVS